MSINVLGYGEREIMAGDVDGVPHTFFLGSVRTVSFCEIWLSLTVLV
jgi:hypothetical protein